MTAPQITITRITLTFGLEAGMHHAMAVPTVLGPGQMVPAFVKVHQTIVNGEDPSLSAEVGGFLLDNSGASCLLDLDEEQLHAQAQWLQEIVKDARRAADAADRELVVNP